MLENLYQKSLIERSKSTLNHGANPDADIIFTAYNPLCGDKFTFYLTVKKGKISSAVFEGHGCSISKASSSILTEKIIGNNSDAIHALISDLKELIDPNNKFQPEKITRDSALLSLSGVRQYPERKDCVNLGWKELEKVISSL